MEPFPELWDSLRQTTGKEQKLAFLEYCKKHVELVEKGEIREEDAAYSMVGAFSIDGIMQDESLNPIIEAAGPAEIPREVSYNQPTGQWDAKTADVLKKREWEEVLRAIKEVEENIHA